MKQRRESEQSTEKEFNSLLLQAKNKEELTKDHLNKPSIESIDEKQTSPDLTKKDYKQIFGQSQGNWAIKTVSDYDHGKLKTAPKLNKTTHDKINKNKFSYKSDAEFSLA